MLLMLPLWVTAEFMCAKTCTCYEHLPWITCRRYVSKIDPIFRYGIKTVILQGMDIFPTELLNKTRWPSLEFVSIVYTGIICQPDFMNAHFKIIGCSKTTTTVRTTTTVYTQRRLYSTWKTRKVPHAELQSPSTEIKSTPVYQVSTQPVPPSTPTDLTTASTNASSRFIVTEARDRLSTDGSPVTWTGQESSPFTPLYAQGALFISLLVIATLLLTSTVVLACLLVRGGYRPKHIVIKRKRHPSIETIGSSDSSIEQFDRAKELPLRRRSRSMDKTD